MVDVVGCLGYCGQEIFFLDSERFGFIAGRGVCIYDVKKGPREMIWSFKSHNNSNNSFGNYDDTEKDDSLTGDYKGIKKVAVNFENKIIALCYRVSGGSGDVDILKINDQSLLCTAENPTSAELVEVKFSRQGDRLFAISDASTGDHEILIWKLTGTKAVLLLSAKLNLVCKYCFVNPCDSNYFVLYGDDSPYIVVGVVTEILGQYSLKLFPVKCSLDSNAENTKIQYALWIPISAGGDVKNPDDSNRLLVGLGAAAAGAVFEVRCGPLVNSAPIQSQTIAVPGISGSILSTQAGYVGRYLGRFTVPSAGIESTGRILIPTCAVLSSSQNIVIGTEDGSVYWFPLLGLPSNASEVNGIVGFTSPLQQMVLPNAVGSITMDEEFSFIVVGTRAGDIFKASLELKETSLLNYEGEKRGDGVDHHHHRADDEIGMSLANALIDVEQVQPEIVGQEMKSGSILCCKYLSMGVKCAGRTKPTLSMFLTGSHLGIITFWRQQAAHTVENLTQGGGIRKSAPRAISSILNITTGQQRLPNKSHGHSSAKAVCRNPAVCTIDFIQFPEKPYFYLIFVGTDDGWLEIWSLEALEHSEEDDVKESPDQKIVDDDEGSGLVRLVTRKIYDYRLYHTALSTMVPINFFSDGKNYFNIATASHLDSRVFLLNVITNEKVTLKNLPHFITLDNKEQPQSLVYTNNVLQVWCKSGSIFVFSMESEDDNYGRIESKLGFSGLFQSMLLKQESAFIVLGETNIMYSLPYDLITQIISEGSNSAFANAVGTDLISVRKFEHEDVVVTVNQSPNGRFIATGSVDGTVYLWRIDPDDSSINLANKIYLHAGAVLGLAFSADSSLLMSTAIDGSCFIVTVDKPLPKVNLKSGMSNAGINLSKFFAEDFSSVLTSKESHFQQYGTMTWLELKEAEKLKEMQLNFKFKSMGITSAVNEISHRLKILLQQNEDRSDLEKMNREEFVIDEDRKNILIAERAQKISDIHSMYVKRNTWHELRAARVRQKCWDSMEVKSVTLLSFALSSTAFLSTDVGVGKRSFKHAVSSFPISKNTPENIDTIEKVKRLRGIEVKTQHSSSLGSVHRVPGASGIHRSAWYTSLKGCPATVTWISNDGTRWPVNDQIDNLLSNEKLVSGNAAQAADGKDKEKGAAPAVAVVDDDDEMSANSLDDDHGIDENNILNLLYPPHAVRTQVQKRTQIVLLKEVVRQLRMRFNEKFTQLYKEKEDIFGSIESRNVRIRAILDDLHQKDEVVSLKMTDLETPGSALRVDASELTSKPYESEAVKAARLREEEERIRKALENDKEDIKGRALDEMMFGTLEVKRDVFAEASALQKPEWMDTILVSEMNESELKEYDAFQQKLKTLQEEQASYRKLLEQEMKKLKNEIADSCKVFDEKLDEMSKLKVLVHREILSIEIYISRLALNMAKTEQTWKSLKKTEQQIQSLRKDRNEVRSKIDTFSVKFEEMKTRIGVLQEEERQLDKSFKRDLQNLCSNTFDQDSLKIFTMLFRMRTYPRGAYNGDGTNADSFGGDQSEVNQSESGNKTRSKGKSAGGASASKTTKYGRSTKGKGKDSSGGQGLNESAAGGESKGKSRMKASNKAGASASNNAMGPMQQAAEALKSSLEEGSKTSLERDPFYDALLRQDKVKKMNEGQIPVYNTLSMESDCPEDFIVDQFSWAKLNDLRSARIDKEIEVKKLLQEFADLKGKLERLDAEEAVLLSCLNEMKSARDVLVAGLRTLESDLDIVVCLRQGQDEVDKDAAVTDYSKALMLPTEILGKYNSRIKELGREKIAILTKTKQFRRKINMFDWEAKHNFMEAKHFEAYLTDLQLFRVTRELQKIIRDGSDASQTKERLEKVALRKEFLQKDAEEKLNTLRLNNDLLKKQLQERNQECAQLEMRISSLHGQVSSCQAVKNSRDEARGEESSPANIAAGKMKKVVGRRNMVDTARAQAEEIDFLRQELDKMRQRTFPSFVRATRKRVAANSEMEGI